MFLARNSFLALLIFLTSSSFAQHLATDSKTILEQTSSAVMDEQIMRTTLCYLDQVVNMATSNLAQQEAVLLRLLHAVIEKNQAPTNLSNAATAQLAVIAESKKELEVISKSLESLLAKQSILPSLRDLSIKKPSNLAPRNYFGSRQELCRNLYECPPTEE